MEFTMYKIDPTAKGLVLIDLDKTIIDRNYQITDPKVILTLVSMQKDGWVVGLNSDTAFDTLKGWANKLQLTGPLVCELGNAVHQSQLHPNHLWYNAKAKAVFTKILNQLVVTIREVTPPGVHLAIHFEETIEALRKMSQPHGLDVLPQEMWVLVNPLRYFSLGLYVRTVTNKSCIFDQPAAEMLAMIVKMVEAMSQTPLLIDHNPEYGIFIAHLPQAAKSQANQAIHLMVSDSQPIYMIGDSTSDDLHDLDIKQLAVGNAKTEYKKVCSFIADADYSSGVIECLEWIQSRD